MKKFSKKIKTNFTCENSRVFEFRNFKISIFSKFEFRKVYIFPNWNFQILLLFCFSKLRKTKLNSLFYFEFRKKLVKNNRKSKKKIKIEKSLKRRALMCKQKCHLANYSTLHFLCLAVEFGRKK